MALAGGRLQAYEKTSVELSYPSVVRFTGHVQLKGLAARTVESDVCMIRQLAAWGRRDPAELTEEELRDYFLHLVREPKYAPATLRQARASLGCFYLELPGRTDWKVFSQVKTRDRGRLPASPSVSAALRLMRVRHFGWSAAARERYARVRGLLWACCGPAVGLLRAGEAVLMIHDKPAIGCPACGLCHEVPARPAPPRPAAAPSLACLT